MRYLLILDAALCALATTLAIVLAVVWLMYGFHTDLSARVGAEMPTVATAVGAFSVMAAVLAAALWSLLRGKSWYGWAHAAAVLMVGLCSMFLYDLFTV